MSAPQKKPLTLEQRAVIICEMRGQFDKEVTAKLNSCVTEAIHNACAHAAIVEAEEEGLDIKTILKEYVPRLQGSFVNLDMMLRVQLTERAAKIKQDKIDAPIRKAQFEIRQLITHAIQHMDLKEHHLLNATMTELHPKLKGSPDVVRIQFKKDFLMLDKYCDQARCWVNPSTLIPKAKDEASSK